MSQEPYKGVTHMKKSVKVLIILSSIVVVLIIAVAMLFFRPMQLNNVVIQYHAPNLEVIQDHLDSTREFYEDVLNGAVQPEFDAQVVFVDNPFPSNDPNDYITFRIRGNFSNRGLINQTLQTAFLLNPQASSRIRTVLRFTFAPTVISGFGSQNDQHIATVFMYARNLEDLNALEDYIRSLRFELTTSGIITQTRTINLSDASFNYELFNNERFPIEQ